MLECSRLFPLRAIFSQIFLIDGHKSRFVSAKSESPGIACKKDFP